MEIIRGKISAAQKVVIYGPEGIGKSTFASQFPEPLFIDTEGSTKHLDVARMQTPSSWTHLLQEISYVKANPKICKTLVIDTADWAEILCTREFCDTKQISGIEDLGYGKGYIYLAEEFGKMLNLLGDVIDIGINVVITAHAQMRKFEQPDELGAYDRWELKLQKKTAPLLKEWADMVLFANYKTIVVNVDNQGASKGKNKVQGGQRVMYTSHHPCWDAKNRHNLEGDLPFVFEAVAHCFSNQQNAKVETEKQLDMSENVNAEPAIYTSENAVQTHGFDGIPKALADLMMPEKVTVEEIQKVVAKKGYYTIDTPIQNYDESFVGGVLVGAWKQVLDMILEERMPF